MKLLTKTTLYIATLSLFLFFFMGIIFFQVLKNMSLTDLNRELYGIKEMVDDVFPHFLGGQLTGLPGVDSIAIRAGGPEMASEDQFGDTLMFDSRTEQFRTFRYLQFKAEHGGANYKVVLYKSTTPADKLVEQVTLMMTVMVILFMAGIFFLNRFIFRNLWKDFFDALEKLKQFDTTKEAVTLGEPDVEEFLELKEVLEKMTQRLSREYRELKEYTDHTTHELQTPLAVIKTKTELLMQSANLGPEEMQLLQSINASVNHLSRLNSTLALMTRIENQQFTGREDISLKDLTDEHLEMFQELIGLRDLQVERVYAAQEVILTMDKGLADILITNLLKNAVVHNEDGGKIVCRVSKGKLEISNSGKVLGFKQSDLFKRFVRDTTKTGNFGLGLSIAKKICDHYGLDIQYDYRDQMHYFSIYFN